MLPEGIHWPCTSSRVLFVRKCYAPLFESVLRACLPSSTPEFDQLIVSGQPGIGKSVFGYVRCGRKGESRWEPLS